VLLGLMIGSPQLAIAGMVVAGDLLVDLRAEDLAYGIATDWENHGSLAGFTPVAGPIVEDVGGRKAVTFSGSNYFVGPKSIPAIEGAGTRSIEVWAYNPSFTDEETLVHWSHRGGPDRSNMAFNYGQHLTWGAAAHWGSGDMGWGVHSPAPTAGTWWHLAYTYDGTTVRIYVNGELDTQKDLALSTYAGCPIRIAAQGDASATGQGVNASSAFTGSIAEVRIHSGVLSASDVANNFKSRPTSLPAVYPSPVKDATDVVRDVVLSWKPGQSAKTHDVYLGTVFEDVNAADRTNPKAVLAVKDNDANVFDPAGLLDFGQTYYWRVDEVNGAPDFSIYKGNLWSFTAETYGYPVKPVKATASSSSNSLMGPEKTIDGSGLDALDQHSTSASHMWLSKKNTTPIWIKYDFDKVYKLHEMWVWNSNQATELDAGFGAKEVTIETSLDGTTWAALGDPVEFNQATGEPNYTHNTTVDLRGVQAQYVRLTIASNWADGTKQAGLSEVRFFYVPVKAFGPDPAPGATGVAIDATLNWRSGREAVQHQVYLGTDPNSLALVKTVTGHNLALGSLGLLYGKTYYWKVNEVNDSATPAVWEGDVWSFTTPDAFVVDDFEKYNDTCNRVFFSWVDGFGYSESPACGIAGSSGNGTGSTVGNVNPPFAERTIVLGGKQSMPLSYDNTSGKSTSEAVRTFTPAQDWTAGGVKTLVLYFHGTADNGQGQLYVKINGTKVDYTGNAAALSTAVWKQWNVDLASVPGLQAVKTLTIGISGSGKGNLLIDNILLYRSAPSVVVPVDPGTNGLQMYLPLDGNTNDASGHGYAGTAQGNFTYVDAPAGHGQAIQLSGTSGYVDIPTLGNLVSTLTSATVATWVNYGGSGGDWQRIFDFGTGTTDYMMLSPHQTLTGPMTFGITVGTPVLTRAEQRCVAPQTLMTGWHHVAVVFDSTTMGVRLVLDGTPVASTTMTVLPKDLGKTTQNWLGRSQFTADAYLNGALDEFRIYSRALSEAELRYLAGDR
jgi:hypothetical protein